MDKETTYFVKFKEQIFGPMNQTNLIDEISLGNIPKSALWSSNQLIWKPLSTIPGLYVHKIIVKGTEEPKTGIFLSTKSNYIENHNDFNFLPTPLQTAIILGGAGVFLICIILILASLASNKNINNSNEIIINKINKDNKKNDDQKKVIKNLPIENKIKEKPDRINNKNKMPPGNGNQKLLPEDIFEVCAPSVAQIFDETGTGSGFLVAQGLLVTNDHVVSPKKVGEQVNVKFHSAKGDEAELKKGLIIKRIPHRDLAFVSVDSNLPSLELAPSDHFRPGRQVVAIGSPGLATKDRVLPNTIAQGVIGQIVNLAFIDLLQLSIAINGGNSGGPAIDSSGKVVGVITSKGRFVDGIAFCVPSDQVTKELEELVRK